MSTDERKGVAQSPVESGPFLAKVVSNNDPTYMGGLEVQLITEVGSDDSAAAQLRPVKYLSPFYGVTNIDYVGQDDDYNNTQKSHGMWFVPPDVGTLVLVIFVGGDPRKGYWIGCVQDENMNFMLPGYAATKFKVSGVDERVPVAEYNKVSKGSTLDPTKILKPEHPFAKILQTQGLIKDDARGITSSSARRESPSMVFGVSTPGPMDKQQGAKKGKVGKAEHKIANAFVSRLGGSSFVMDDGDDKFLRKKSPSEGPPEYTAIEQGQTGGDVTRPHNELIRLRTRTGHQILLNNSEDLIYIGNARGTSWIELSSDGKIDIYAEDSISVHTAQDLNFYAGRDINMQAGRNFNTKVAGEMHTQTAKDHILIVDANQKIHIKGNVDHTIVGNTKEKVNGNFNLNVTGYIYQTSGGANHTKAGGNIIETAPAIHMNGPSASSALAAELPKSLKTHLLPTETNGSIGDLIMRRMPTHEPYPQHENLDPTKYKATKTDRDVDGRYEGQSTSIKDPASYWKKYGNVNDTFEKLKGREG
jgi:hypothetical protein